MTTACNVKELKRQKKYLLRFIHKKNKSMSLDKMP